MRTRRSLRKPVFFIVLGLLLVLVGIFANEEHLVVLAKATRICMECIGLG